jgi:hypothetical protein
MAPFDAANRAGLARDRFATGDGEGALGDAAPILGDRRADRHTRLEAARLIGEIVAVNAKLGGGCARLVGARASGTPFDQATDLALAHCQRAAGVSADADKALARATKGFTPGAVELVFGRARVAAGDRAGAEPHLELAQFWLRTAEPAVALFDDRRALGNHAGAVFALDPPTLATYRAASPYFAGDPARAQASAEAASWLGPEGARVAADAADSAEKAGDLMAAAFFHDVLGVVKRDPAERRRAFTLRERALAEASRDRGQVVSYQEAF